MKEETDPRALKIPAEKNESCTDTTVKQTRRASNRGTTIPIRHSASRHHNYVGAIGDVEIGGQGVLSSLKESMGGKGRTEMGGNLQICVKGEVVVVPREQPAKPRYNKGIGKVCSTTPSFRWENTIARRLACAQGRQKHHHKFPCERPRQDQTDQGKCSTETGNLPEPAKGDRKKDPPLQPPSK